MKPEDITPQLSFLEYIYARNIENPSLDFMTRVSGGAEILAKKAMHFWQDKVFLHEEGVHNLLVNLNVASDIQQAMHQARSYLSNLSQSYGGTLLQVSESGHNAYLFRRTVL
jgi:hypothetical protein